MDSKKIKIEVAYAKPDRQRIIELELGAGSTVGAAILHSRILDEFPDIDLSKQKVGVFGRLREWQDVLKDGDRVEIYRSLILDPKNARRAKAKQLKKK